MRADLTATDEGRKSRAAGQTVVASALWYTGPGLAELRHERLGPPAPGEARVATQFSGVSRGTERLVFMGQVPAQEAQRMRAPLQVGAFPYPVKYGYSAAGIVTAGPADLVGKSVFCLHPHQDHFIAPVDMLLPLPEDVPARRATLAANMETALNAHWDAGTAPGDRVLVIGGGIVGMLVADLAARLPGTSVTVVDIDLSRRVAAEALGAAFSTPDAAPAGANIIFHTTATAAGLNLAIAKSAFEATIVELSWYGASETAVALGGAFHSQRLKIISSQVGTVAASRRSYCSHRQRLATAINLLTNPALDCLVAGEVSFNTSVEALPSLLLSHDHPFPPVIRYGE